jgi:hypothetical protein
MMTYLDKIKIVTEILKKRFPNMTPEEVVNTSFEIIEALFGPPTKFEEKKDD